MAQGTKRQRELEDVVAGVSAEIKADEAVESPPKKKQQQRRSLFVRSLPAIATTEKLVAYFSQSYPIKHATVVMDPATKACKGYGFVTFADAEDAQKALEDFNGKVFEGRKIKIEVAEPRHRDVEDAVPGAIAAGQAKPRSVPAAAALEAKAKRKAEKEEKQAEHQAPRLIVRNLPWSIKKPEQLSELFQSYGKIKQVVLPSKEPGRMSGFGFVLLRGRKNAEKAMAAINGKEIDGRTLAVDWAVEKKTYESATHTQDKEDTGEDLTAKDEDNDASVKSEDEHDAGVALDDEEDDELDDEENDEENEDDFEDDDEDEDDMESDQHDTSATTLFIRNLPFTTTDDTLRDHFAAFGPLRYARIVLDPGTERPKGTGFVCFVKPEDALQCLREAPRPSIIQQPKKSTGSADTGPSILQNEADDPSGKYTLDGRVLQIARAVAKGEAERLTEEGVNKRGERDKDKRRLYLLSEGTISSKSSLYGLLSSTEIAMREASAKQRQQLIRTNPSLHLSLTRLSIRNIPRSVTSADLKQLAREAVVGFATDLKEGKRTRLSKEELARGADMMRDAEKERKKRGVGVVKQAKVVFEGKEGGKINEASGAGRSRGYGFVEYYTHRSALMGLRWLNGHVIDYKTKAEKAGVKSGGKGTLGKEELQERRKRLIVEFAIENAQVVNRRSEREKKARKEPGSEEFGRRDRKGAVKNGLFRTVDVKSVDDKEPAVKKKEVGKGDVGDVDKQANRQRIIGRKRMARKAKRTGH